MERGHGVESIKRVTKSPRSPVVADSDELEAISSYLRYGRRTVQRWERNGLPTLSSRLESRRKHFSSTRNPIAFMMGVGYDDSVQHIYFGSTLKQWCGISWRFISRTDLPILILLQASVATALGAER